MNKFDKIIKEQIKKEAFLVPQGYEKRLEMTCQGLKEHTRSFYRPRRIKEVALGVVVILGIFIITPNVSARAAQTLGEIPLLGKVIKVVTFRHYNQHTSHTEAEVAIPQLEADGNATQEVNNEVATYIEGLITSFKEHCKTLGEGYESLKVDYQVITDNAQWFTLRIDALQIQASGYQFSKIYNINKRTDEQVTLENLFQENSEWEIVLYKELQRQMTEQMADPSLGAAYFIEEFKAVEPNQNYYFDKQGNLVLVYDEYQIAPGYMGRVEFTIAADVFNNLLKPDLKIITE